jgi:hypothetical protein
MMTLMTTNLLEEISSMNLLILVGKTTSRTTPKARAKKVLSILQIHVGTIIRSMMTKMTLALVVEALLLAVLGTQTHGTPTSSTPILHGNLAIPTVTRAIPKKETEEERVGILLSQ